MGVTEKSFLGFIPQIFLLNDTSLLVTIAPSERDQVQGNESLNNTVNGLPDKGIGRGPQLRWVILAFVIVLLTVSVVFLLTPPSHSKGNAIVPLNTIAQQTLVTYLKNPARFNANTWIAQYTVAKPYQQPKGVFVTFSKAGKTRACWGTMQPQQSNLVKETVFSTLSALNKDYRFPPIRLSEVTDLHTQVTVVDNVQPVASITSINPLRDGLWVRSQGKSGVILAGEASDATYQLMLAKVKAGIQPHEVFTLYRMKTHAIQ